jgi:hypothetical protein
MDQSEQKQDQRKYRCKANVDYNGKSFRKDQIYLESDIAAVPPERRFKFEPLEIVTIQADFQRLIDQTDDENINKIIQLSQSVSALAIDNDSKDREIARLGAVITEKDIALAGKNEAIRGLQIRIREMETTAGDTTSAKHSKKTTKK